LRVEQPAGDAGGAEVEALGSLFDQQLCEIGKVGGDSQVEALKVQRVVERAVDVDPRFEQSSAQGDGERARRTQQLLEVSDGSAQREAAAVECAGDVDDRHRGLILLDRELGDHQVDDRRLRFGNDEHVEVLRAHVAQIHAERPAVFRLCLELCGWPPPCPSARHCGQVGLDAPLRAVDLEAGDLQPSKNQVAQVQPELDAIRHQQVRRLPARQIRDGDVERGEPHGRQDVECQVPAQLDVEIQCARQDALDHGAAVVEVQGLEQPQPAAEQGQRTDDQEESQQPLAGAHVGLGFAAQGRPRTECARHHTRPVAVMPLRQPRMARWPDG
jgi:hypothetical protein